MEPRNHALIIQFLEFLHKLDNEFVSLNNLVSCNLALVENSNGVDKLAKVSEVWSRKDPVQKCRSEDENVCEEFPRFVAT